MHAIPSIQILTIFHIHFNYASGKIKNKKIKNVFELIIIIKKNNIYLCKQKNKIK